jgi:predicted permease
MDFRYALRALRRTPGFALMAIATLALGIGINTVVFTVYDSVAFHRLGVRAPGEIERLEWSRGSYPDDRFSWEEYRRVAAAGRSFAAAAATSDDEIVLCGLDGGSANRVAVHARFVSGNYFEALGVTAQIGRAVNPSDRAAAVISDRFWKSRLHSDPDVYGRTILAGPIQNEHASLTIVGVAPPSFEGTGQPAQIPDLWITASDQPSVLPGVDWIHDPSAREWQVLGRRAPGVTHRQTQADLAVSGASWPLEAGKPVSLTSVPATFFQTGSGGFEGFALICAVLLVAVGLILFMGCINLIALVAARNAARRHEIAIRLALGASRLRLMRQLCSESLLLGIAGGAAGLVLSVAACGWLTLEAARLFDNLTGQALTVPLDFATDWRTLAWTAVLSILTGVAVGLGPALRSSKRDVIGALRQSGGAGGREITRRRSLLVTAQVASCLILLSAAGLLFRGAARSPQTDPGFDVAHTMLAQINATALASTAAGRAGLIRRAVEQARAVPGVQSVSWADRPPFLGHGSRTFSSDAGAMLNCIFNGVSEDYFATLGIRLLAGRNFTREEVEAGAPVAVIGESAAHRLWPDENPLGRRIATSRIETSEHARNDKSYTVIGVVSTVRSTYLSKADEGYVYLTKPLPDTWVTLLIRTSGAPENFFRPLAAALGTVNAGLYMVAIARTPMKIELWMAEAPAIAASILGGLALLLACLGIFGVISRLVALRTRELGIRIALGATKKDVVTLVGRQTLLSVVWGAAVGLAGALGVSALLQSLIVMPDVPDLTYGAGAFDPVTFAGVLGALAVTIAVASLLPMRRAIRVEPAVALRDE